MARITPGYPVLMYHKVGAELTDPADQFLNVSALSFRRQMRVLARLGYRARPFGDILEALQRGQTLPRKTFAITFDDGYQCVGEAAVPILAEFDFPATVFVVSDCVGTTNRWDRDTGHPEISLMDWRKLGELQTLGWEIGGHSRTHPHLNGLTEAEAYAQIVDSKQATEARLGVDLRAFCYPYGHFNADTPALVSKAGFVGACTIRSGLAHPRHSLCLQPRVKVYHEGILDLLYRVLLRPSLPTLRRYRD